MTNSLTLKIVCITLAGVFLFGLFVGIQMGDKRVSKIEAQWEKERAKLATELAEENKIALTRERELTKQFTAAVSVFEEEKNESIIKSEKVIADLRGDALRLRRQWAGCETSRLSATATSATVINDGADDRAESAGRIVRVAAECDAQVKGLQEILRVERQ
ncbi:MAG: hypothetical protein LBE22_07730 [Azoarcus sp.]|jgi:hypothetical protein|nr:hypothetical protein [Azoarcus sp.]